MRSVLHRTALTALAAIAISACNDHLDPTEAAREAGRRSNVVSGSTTTPRISALTLSRNSAFIDGPGVSYTATLNNPGSSLSGVAIQGWMVQGAVTHAAGGTVVFCGSDAGVLPTGTCTVSPASRQAIAALPGPGLSCRGRQRSSWC